MKKLLSIFAIITLVIAICFSITGCKWFSTVNPDRGDDETQGTEPPQDEDPPADEDPKYVTVEGDNGVYAVLPENSLIFVDNIVVRSEEYEETIIVLEESNVDLTNRAWTMFNLNVEPEDEADAEPMPEFGKVSISKPIPTVNDYLVYEINENEAESVEFIDEGEVITVNEWYYDNTYLVITEEEFDIVYYYEQNDQPIYGYVNIGADTAADAYEKGQTRKLQVFAVIGGDYIINGEETENWIYVNGDPVPSYNYDSPEGGINRGYELEYNEQVNLIASEDPEGYGIYGFAGWYRGEIDEVDSSGSLIIELEDEPYSTDYRYTMEMPAEDITLFAVYDFIVTYKAIGQNCKVSFNGGEFADEQTVSLCYEKKATLTAEPNENCYFSHWAYEEDLSFPISVEPTYVHSLPSGLPKNVVAVCYQYHQYTYHVFSDCSDPLTEDDYAEYKFVINGEDYFDNYYSETFWEKETLTITAVPVKNCRFLGWSFISPGDYADIGNYYLDYEFVKEGIGETDPTLVITPENNAFYKGTRIIAVYEMLPQNDLYVQSIYVDNENNDNDSGIWVDGEERWDDYYYDRLAEGQQVTLRAVAQTNCRFEGWYICTFNDETGVEFGECLSNTAEFTYTMGNEEVWVVAKFESIETYSVNARTTSGADIYVNGENYYSTLIRSYEEGAKLSFDLEVKDGYEFKGWYIYNGNYSSLISSEPEFEYTVGTSNLVFEAKVEAVVLHEIIVRIMSPVLSVTADEHEMEYIPEESIFKSYVFWRKDGSVVNIKANVAENDENLDFYHWKINGEIIADIEYSFTVNESINIYVYAAPKYDAINIRTHAFGNVGCATYSTDYYTGRYYLSSIMISDNYIRLEDITNYLVVDKYFNGDKVHSESPGKFNDLFDIDFGENCHRLDDGSLYFKNEIKHTVTITDKKNPEIQFVFDIYVMAIDYTGTYVWVTDTDEFYHKDPFHINEHFNNSTIKVLTVEEAEARGYKACECFSQ